MICLRCNHYAQADQELERAQGSERCGCECHRAKCAHCGVALPAGVQSRCCAECREALDELARAPLHKIIGDSYDRARRNRNLRRRRR